MAEDLIFMHPVMHRAKRCQTRSEGGQHGRGVSSRNSAVQLE